MSEKESSILQYLKSELGKEGPPRTEVVENGSVRRYINALGDHNPLYENEEIASSSRFGGRIVPPLFFMLFGRERRPRPDKRLGKSAVNAGHEFEFFKPLRLGDVITHTTKLADFKERSGGMGKMYILTYQTDFRNQKGEQVAIGRVTRITFENPPEEQK